MSTTNTTKPKFNTRLGTSTNLPENATHDILLIGFPDSFPEGRITFELADTPRKITGIQKVAQIFLKILFTSVGSNVLYPRQGTKFPLLTVNANRTSNDHLFMSELSTEVRSAESQTKYALNSATANVADQLENVTIVGMDVATESLVMYLKLTTKAGALAQVAIPFPELDLQLSD